MIYADEIKTSTTNNYVMEVIPNLIWFIKPNVTGCYIMKSSTGVISFAWGEQGSHLEIPDEHSQVFLYETCPIDVFPWKSNGKI